MSDNSPNSFRVKPESTQVSKKYLLYALLCVLSLFFAFMYGKMSNSKSNQEVNVKSQEVAISATQTNQEIFPSSPRSGLNVQQEKQTSGIITPPAPKEEPPTPVQIVQAPGLSEEESYIRRMRSSAYLEALKSPMLAMRNTNQNNVGTIMLEGGQNNLSLLNTTGLPTPSANIPASATQLTTNGYDVSADIDKESFANRSAQHDSLWTANFARTMGQKYELKTGTVVPGVMVSGINSDLPGTLIAQVSQNVYDTATGQYLLIPQGSKLFGVYDSRLVYGQSRVLIAWNRVIFPDGSSLTLPAMPGTDMSGYSGFHDEVNNHYMKIFGSAILMSLITGGLSYAIDSVAPDTDSESTLQSQMTSALAQQLGQATTSLLQQNLSIKPTLEIRPGYQFNIVFTKDFVFTAPYKAWR